MTEPQTPRTPLEQIFFGQARVSRTMGSPFSAAVLEVMLADLQAGGVFAEVLEPFAGLDLNGQIDAATPIRPLGWAHFMALGGEASALSALYPPNVTEADPDALAAVLIPLARARQAELSAFIASPPQTNEVRRTLCLFGGFATRYLEALTPEQVDKFESLIAEMDTDLFNWVTDKQPVPAELDHDVMAKIKHFVRNEAAST